jgi:hypothetical protein
MERQLVSSSNLNSVGYETESAILEVSFRNGRTYQYYQVPVAVWQGLMSAYSKGRYFADYVKDRYRQRRV